MTREHLAFAPSTAASNCAYPECALSTSRGTIMSMSMHTTPSSCATTDEPESPSPSRPPLHEFSAAGDVFSYAGVHAASSFFPDTRSVYSV